MADVNQVRCWDCGGVVDDALAAICPACGANLYAPPPPVPPRAAAEERAPAPGGAPDGVPDGAPDGAPDAAPPGPAAPVARTPVLVLPDGTRLPIPDGKLEIGRECGAAAVDDALAPYVDVSRRHAVIARTGSRLLLTEIKENSFGTEVDGRRLAPFTPVPIAAGARIKLGSHCYLTVEETDV